MNKQTFSQLAPFIQEYIYQQNWSELRPIQIAACQVILETNAHLLIAAGTASGKTEAAFLPVLTLLNQNPVNTIGVLYIGPIKALINDQFARLTNLLKLSQIPVYHWHGDVSQNRKNQVLKNPQGILQITPESLESLLINKHQEIPKLFGKLQFIIIDEIHAFMGSERGDQILCQLQRLAYLTNNIPRRIGLSATLGDYSLAEKWLSSGTNQPVITPQIDTGKRQIKLALEHFYDEKDDQNSPYYQYIFKLTKSCKSLIFANSRTQTESIITALREMAKKQSFPDIYHVHHGSISASLRQIAETAMRERNKPAVTAATLTLELGIDIGELERVIQLESPLSVSSFLQRLGRSGRRGETADMRFICAENSLSNDDLLPNQIPWQFLQCIAIIQLYLEEKWIEPINPIQYPFSLLYHQTMSIIAAMGEISPGKLAKQVLQFAVFQNISQDDYLLLLRHLININHIQKNETGKLILGLAGEKVVRKFQFYAVFADSQEFIVKHGKTEIGSVVIPPTVGSQLILAGKNWQVAEVDFNKKVILVKINQENNGNISNSKSSYWRGSSGNIHGKIIRKMRDILLEDTIYGYLQKNAISRLSTVRQLVRKSGLDKENIVLLDDGKCYIFPWLGTVSYRTLERLINTFCRESLEITTIGGLSPYYLSLKLPKDKVKSVHSEITNLCQQNISPECLVSGIEAPKINKYDEFIPDALLRKAFIYDYFDTQIPDF